MLFQVMKRKHAGQQQTVPHPMDTARSQRESDLPKGLCKSLTYGGDVRRDRQAPADSV